MAQTGLRSFFPVRRRREDDTHAAIKRRKLTENNRIDLPSQVEQSSLEYDEQEIASVDGGSKCEVSAPRTRRSTRSKKATTSTTTSTTAKKTPSTRGRRSKKGVTTSLDVPNIQTLFQLINQASTSSDSTSPAATTTATTGKGKLSDECPLPESSSESSSKQTTPNSSPFKVPSTRHTLKSRSLTPKSSPLKESTTILSPARSSSMLETRGARLLRLAKEKMATKSPNSKPSSPAVSAYPSVEPRVTKMAARRKLLTSAPPTTNSKGKSAARFLSSATSLKDQSRQEMVGDLYKLSKKELAQQTRFETTTKSKQKQQKDDNKEKGGSKSPKLREFGAFVFESPTKNEASKTRLPAYQKFHALAQPVAPPSTTPTKEAPLPLSSTVDLPLPYKYQLLEEKFRCTDTVVSMLQKRKEICTFDKLKKGVQEMCRRQFEQNNLGQMKTVYPTAFNFRQEKNIPGLYDNNQRHKYHLTVECSLEEEGGEGGSRDGGSASETKKKTGTINPTTLIKRRRRFNHNLTELAKKHHKSFLASLDPPLAIPDEKVHRWHPTFALDSVPDIAAAPLPTPPIKETYSTAKDVLNVTQGRLAKRVQAALASVGESEAGDAGESVHVETKKESDMNTPELKGVSAALLEKVRAKEAAKAKLTITRDPVKERQLEMLSRLPDFVRIVKGFFVTEKKAALLREDVVKMLVDSHPSRLPSDKVESHLQYLLEVLPEWIKSVKVSKGLFIKIEKKADLKSVMAKLERTKSKLAKQN